MKVCSNCLKCYDDSIETCPAEDRPTLTVLRTGDCLVIKGYRIDSQIESDSPVVRFRATHLASEKKVNAKFIMREESASRLEDEMRTAADLAHPNIARVFDFGEVSEDEIFVLYEETPGESLRCFLKKAAPLSELRAIEITRQIAEGLEELHSANLIHRAVAPENIFITSSSDGELSVKLSNIDFGGVAQKAVAEGAHGVDARTNVLRYFSPEQFSGKEIDFRSDIFSLGVVFYELLLARSPYTSFDPAVISEFVFNESDLKDLHLDLRALAAYSLREAFQQRVDLRPKTTNGFVRQLRHLELIATKAARRLEHSASDMPEEKRHFNNIVEPKKQQPMEAAFVRETLASNYESVTSEKIRQNETSGLLSKEEKLGKDKLKDVSQMEIVPKREPEIELDELKADEVVPVLDFVLQPRNVVPENIVSVVRDEPETATGPIEKEEPGAPRAMGSFESYPQAHVPGVNKILLYLAGILVSAIFGGFLTASIFDWQSDVDSSVATSPAESGANKKENASKNKMREVADISDDEFDARRNQETTETDVSNWEEIRSRTASENDVQRLTARKSSNISPANKLRAKRRVKKKRKTRRKKKPTPIVKTDGRTRPRIVSKVVITY